MISEVEQVPQADDVFSPENGRGLDVAGTEIVSMGQIPVDAVKCPCCSYEFLPGQTFEPMLPSKAGKKLLTRVKELMNERSRLPNGHYNYRFDDIANSIVSAMERGYWPAIQEFINREEGKVPTRMTDADGKNLKMYVGMPVEGEESP